MASCPRCGREPRLVKTFKHAEDEPRTRYSLVGYRYECRRWLGLRVCLAGPAFHWNEKGWGDLAMRYATEKWNALASRPDA